MPHKSRQMLASLFAIISLIWIGCARSPGVTETGIVLTHASSNRVAFIPDTSVEDWESIVAEVRQSLDNQEETPFLDDLPSDLRNRLQFEIRFLPEMISVRGLNLSRDYETGRASLSGDSSGGSLYASTENPPHLPSDLDRKVEVEFQVLPIIGLQCGVEGHLHDYMLALLLQVHANMLHRSNALSDQEREFMEAMVDRQMNRMIQSLRHVVTRNGKVIELE